MTLSIEQTILRKDFNINITDNYNLCYKANIRQFDWICFKIIYFEEDISGAEKPVSSTSVP